MNNEIKILAIIQARVGSTRLNSKVLMNICGKPMLWHVVNRVRSSTKLSAIVLAIPDNPSNDILGEFAQNNNLLCFKGDENDVLSRFYFAAKKYGGQEIVRLTADNPLVDPELIDNSIEKHLSCGADYTRTENNPLGTNIEICNFESLEKAYYSSGLGFEREHVTPYVYQHPELFKINIIQAAGKSRRPELRFTVDTLEDLKLVREIYQRFYQPGQNFHINEVIDYLNIYPELLAINADVKQKALGQ